MNEVPALPKIRLLNKNNGIPFKGYRLISDEEIGQNHGKLASIFFARHTKTTIGTFTNGSKPTSQEQLLAFDTEDPSQFTVIPEEDEAFGIGCEAVTNSQAGKIFAEQARFLLREVLDHRILQTNNPTIVLASSEALRAIQYIHLLAHGISIADYQKRCKVIKEPNHYFNSLELEKGKGLNKIETHTKTHQQFSDYYGENASKEFSKRGFTKKMQKRRDASYRGGRHLSRYYLTRRQNPKHNPSFLEGENFPIQYSNPWNCVTDYNIGIHQLFHKYGYGVHFVICGHSHPFILGAHAWNDHPEKKILKDPMWPKGIIYPHACYGLTEQQLQATQTA